MTRRSRVVSAAGLVLIALLGLTSTACSSKTPPAQPPAAVPRATEPSASATPTVNAVRIRIANTGKLDLDNVRVRFSGAEVDYGDVPAGAGTDYRAVKGAYRYAWIRADVDGTPRELRPIDFFGERLLKPGDYTYQVYAVHDHQAFGGLRLSLRTDR